MDLQGKVFVIKNKIYTDIPQTGLGLVFWSGVTELLSTSSFRGNSQAPPVCLLSTWAKKVMCLWLSIKTNDTQYFSFASRVWETHGCLALAEQYFLFLSASLTWPFFWHWPHTNISFRFGGPKRLRAFESCRRKVLRKMSFKPCVFKFLVCVNLIQKAKWYLVLYSSRPNCKAIQNIARHRRRVQVYKPES